MLTRYTMDNFDTHIARRRNPKGIVPPCEAQETAQPMSETEAIRYLRDAFHGRACQNLALLFCFSFGLAIIINAELCGNPMWFWYATLFHHGAKLYADLHLALQPLFVLETNAWIQMVGVKCLAIEALSVIHLALVCIGIQLLLRESRWPDWQKSIVLASAFIICTNFTAYLFNDFHVVQDIFWIFCFVLMLKLAKAESTSRQFGLAATLGVLSGLCLTLRITDGAALFAGVGVCLLVLLRRRKLTGAGLFVVAAALTVTAVLLLTGDSFHDYVSNSIFQAAGSKGGTHSLLADPFLIFVNALKALATARVQKRLLLWVIAIIAAAPLIQRYWKNGVKYTVPLQLGLVATGLAVTTFQLRSQLFEGQLIGEMSILFLVVIYVLAPTIIARYFIWKMNRSGREWDAREIMVLPLLFWLAAGSASTGGSPRDFFEMMALLLVLVTIVDPFRRRSSWVNACLLTLLVLMGFSGAVTKIREPWAWQNYRTSPMFENRQWYRHPIYGPMYMQNDQLQFSVLACHDIEQGNAEPELLSLPFPYPNYFCGTPPWHGYVQTFFDTSTRSTVERMIRELETAPPQWIVYQRQLAMLSIHEQLFNHGQPLAQRDLDTLIMQKIATGQWQLIDKVDYLKGDGWLVVKTRP